MLPWRPQAKVTAVRENTQPSTPTHSRPVGSQEPAGLSQVRVPRRGHVGAPAAWLRGCGVGVGALGATDASLNPQLHPSVALGQAHVRTLLTMCGMKMRFSVWV